MRKTAIFSFLLFYLIDLLPAQKLDLSQDSLYQKNTIVMKLKESFRPLARADGINSFAIAEAVDNLNVVYFKKLFPRHNKPEQSLSPYGDSLVDISLIYQLKYKGKVPAAMVVERLKKTRMFVYVERRPLSKAMMVPNDSLLSHQYYPRVVKAFSAWDVEPGDSDVVIGIVDTGTDINGEDLKDGIHYNYNDTIDGIDNDNDGYIDNFRGWDLGMNDNNPMSYWDHHGCFTTGIASARVNNGVGIAGLGYKTTYLPVRICDDRGYELADYDGIVYAADHGSAVINNSWGGFVKTRFGQDIVNYASYNKNALVVAAAGNSNIDWYLYPASFENVLSCAATDSLDRRWTQSSYGTTVDLCAPGDHVFSTWTYNGYFASSGTSFSAPGVSAAAALVKSHYPNMSALQLGEQVRVTADLIDTVQQNIPFAGLLGSGRLNMYKALTDTSKPSIRFRYRKVTGGNRPGDTIFLSGRFQNFLHPSSAALKAVASSVSPYLSVVNPNFALGSLATFDTVSNYGAPFVIKISPNAPAGLEADIKISYTDTNTNYSGFEYFRFQINPDYADMDTNLLLTTVSSVSTMGYANVQKSHGEGLKYKNSKTLMAWSGLVVANSSAKVSSNIYGDNGYDEDFTAVQNVMPVIPAAEGDKEFVTSFNDNGAGIHKLNIGVTQKTYAYASYPDKVVFMKYTVKNQGVSALNDLYIGFYVDYDIDVSYKNKAYYDSALRLAYTVPTQGGQVAGVMLLDSVPMNVYNIDNDGSEGSVNIYDGFIDYEKYQALTLPRDSAGYVNSYGNDVSNMISAGPFTLLPGDDTTLTFALLAGDYLNDLKQSAQDAINVFYNVAGIKHQENSFVNTRVFPNPFEDKVSVESVKAACVFELSDSYGKIVIRKQLPAGRSTLNLSSLPKGLYYYRLISGKTSRGGKLVKL